MHDVDENGSGIPGGWDGQGEVVPEITTSVITLGLCYLVLSDSQNASKLDHTFYDTSSVFFLYETKYFTLKFSYHPGRLPLRS